MSIIGSPITDVTSTADKAQCPRCEQPAPCLTCHNALQVT
jgi:hypothetical protein